MVIEILSAAGLTAAALQVGMMLRTPHDQKLPSPKKIGLPSGGLATMAAVHVVLGGQPTKRRWWKFQ